MVSSDFHLRKTVPMTVGRTDCQGETQFQLPLGILLQLLRDYRALKPDSMDLKRQISETSGG